MKLSNTLRRGIVKQQVPKRLRHMVLLQLFHIFIYIFFYIPFMYLFALEIVIPYYEAGSVQGNVNNLIRAHFL